MPFKTGWLTTIQADELWQECRPLGFKFLRTLISCFKTSLLNNLITPVSNQNCEKDDMSILENMEKFLQNPTNQDFINMFFFSKK